MTKISWNNYLHKKHIRVFSLSQTAIERNRLKNRHFNDLFQEQFSFLYYNSIKQFSVPYTEKLSIGFLCLSNYQHPENLSNFNENKISNKSYWLEKYFSKTIQVMVYTFFEIIKVFNIQFKFYWNTSYSYFWTELYIRLECFTISILIIMNLLD